MSLDPARFSLSETSPAAPTSAAFVVCPVVLAGGAAGWGWPNIYQLALEQARATVERKTVFERELFVVWN